MIPTPTATDDAAGIIAELDQALDGMASQPVAVTSRTVAGLHQRARTLADAVGLTPAQRKAVAVAAARTATISAELAEHAGHHDRARIMLTTAARYAADVDDPDTIAMVCRVGADHLIESGRYEQAIPVVQRGWERCTRGPQAAALMARAAHAYAGIPRPDPAQVYSLVSIAMAMAQDIPDSHQTLGLSYRGYHVVDAADQAHSAMCLLGRVDRAVTFADDSWPTFETRHMVGFAAYARLERAIALLRAQGRMGVEASCELAGQAARIASHRRLGMLMDMAARWAAAARPHGAIRQVQDTAYTLRLWRAGLL